MQHRITVFKRKTKGNTTICFKQAERCKAEKINGNKLQISIPTHSKKSATKTVNSAAMYKQMNVSLI